MTMSLLRHNNIVTGTEGMWYGKTKHKPLKMRLMKVNASWNSRPSIYFAQLFLSFTYLAFFFHFFCRLPSELTEWNGICHVLGSQLDLKMHVQDLGCPSLWKLDAKKLRTFRPFTTTSQLNGDSTMNIFWTKGVRAYNRKTPLEPTKGPVPYILQKFHRYSASLQAFAHEILQTELRVFSTELCDIFWKRATFATSKMSASASSPKTANLWTGFWQLCYLITSPIFGINGGVDNLRAALETTMNSHCLKILRTLVVKLKAIVAEKIRPALHPCCKLGTLLHKHRKHNMKHCAKLTEAVKCRSYFLAASLFLKLCL